MRASLAPPPHPYASWGALASGRAGQTAVLIKREGSFFFFFFLGFCDCFFKQQTNHVFLSVRFHGSPHHACL